MDRDAQKYTSLQDIGGRTADPVASVGERAADAVDTPMAVSIDKSKKPVAFWEYQTVSAPHGRCKSGGAHGTMRGCGSDAAQAHNSI